MSVSTRIWQEKILIVNDEDVINIMLKAVLEREGIVEFALNEEQALNLLDHDYCAAVVANIDTSVFNCMELFKKAVSKYPGIKERFLFITEDPGSKYIPFFEKNRLNYITRLKDIRKAVEKILHK